MNSAGTMGVLTLVLVSKIEPKFIWPSLMLAATLLFGAVLIAMVSRWRKKTPGEFVSAGDQLSVFRNMYDQGELSKEEFEQIRDKLSGKLRSELSLPETPIELDEPETPETANGQDKDPPPEPPPGPPRDGFRPL